MRILLKLKRLWKAPDFGERLRALDAEWKLEQRQVAAPAIEDEEIRIAMLDGMLVVSGGGVVRFFHVRGVGGCL
ncbi:MAG: hypothetical protein K2X35_05380 [Bryobacteraceae bacterium]|nr:hypothetical protein [Bryobacteraceae bacterium]